MLAILEGTLCNREMMVPIRGDIHQVDVRSLAELDVAFLTTVDGCRGKPLVTQIFLTSFSTFRLVITKGNHLHTRNVGKTIDCTRATHSQTHEADTNSRQLGGCQAQHILLTSRTPAPITRTAPDEKLDIVRVEDQIGGGSAPMVRLPGWAVSVRDGNKSADRTERKLRKADIPVIGRINEDRLLLCVRTMADDEIETVAEALRK